MKLEFTESLTDATRSSVSSAQHRSSLLTLILSNSCTAAFVPVWSLVVISGLFTSNTYVPLSIGVRHRFLKDAARHMACPVSFDWKIEYILEFFSWNILSAWAETHHTCHEFPELPDSHLRFFEQQHRSSCGKSNSIRRICISVNKLNRQQNWYFLWFCYCLEAIHPQQLLLVITALNYLCQSSSFILFFILLVFYLVCSSPVLCI